LISSSSSCVFDVPLDFGKWEDQRDEEASRLRTSADGERLLFFMALPVVCRRTDPRLKKE
jgi:hypothetical protein